jgi:MYXO-CTERM domain-containing protein
MSLILTVTALALATPLGTAPVVGGDFVPSGDWPDAAGIIFSTQWLDVECTGVLVAPDVVLTAGHCADGIKRVILNTNDYEHGGEIHSVSEIHEYPDSQRTYDLTALVLSTPSDIPPRIIATDCIADEDVVNGADVEIVGYGAHNAAGTQYDSKLRQASTTITDADCRDLQNGCQGSVSPGGEVGAGGDGVDACYGDSGGPLYLRTDHGDFVVGLTSRSYWYVQQPCSEGGIYVRPDAVIDWIEDVTGRTLPRPQCGSPPEPVAEPIFVRKDTPGETTIDPRDPDGDDGPYTYEVAFQAGIGHATVDEDGVVDFQPDAGAKGEDVIIVDVTDGTGLTGRASIVVKVLSKSAYNKATGEGGCGCDTGAPAGLGLGAVLLGLAMIRRRR